mmetsp:Transcript_17738/g.56732  ORF Transcript_17738/g.56732 Transcript_17738/m.56732 type:complete len:278 (-) Transcript_17738:41-874(-)
MSTCTRCRTARTAPSGQAGASAPPAGSSSPTPRTRRSPSLSSRCISSLRAPPPLSPRCAASGSQLLTRWRRPSRRCAARTRRSRTTSSRVLSFLRAPSSTPTPRTRLRIWPTARRVSRSTSASWSRWTCARGAALWSRCSLSCRTRGGTSASLARVRTRSTTYAAASSSPTRSLTSTSARRGTSGSAAPTPSACGAQERRRRSPGRRGSLSMLWVRSACSSVFAASAAVCVSSRAGRTGRARRSAHRALCVVPRRTSNSIRARCPSLCSRGGADFCS